MCFSEINEQLKKSKIVEDDDLKKDRLVEHASSNLNQLEDKYLQIKLKGANDFYNHRSRWSWFILLWISLLIVFNIALTVGVGRNWLDFRNYKWFIVAITAETFLQIVGLGYVAAHYLFSDERKK